MQATNKFTMAPTDQEAKERFFKTRATDVIEMFDYAFIFNSIRFALVIIIVLIVQKPKAIIRLVQWSVFSLLYLMVYFLGKRFRHKFLMLIVALEVVKHLLIVLSLEILVKYDQDESSIVKWLHNNVNMQIVVNGLLLTPSIEYILFCYAPLCLATTVYCTIRHSLSFWSIQGPALCSIIVFVLWYIFQRRELRRFYE